tara:strand:+ start:178 stop:855 length:678 start_codon:yes stop_codon:yes gene_type:complete
MNKIYAINHYTFIDRVVAKKRQEMCDIINKELSDTIIEDALDIGSTNDLDNESSNYLIKNLTNIKIYKSISDQEINNSFFSKTLKKSITDIFLDNEVKSMKSDLVVSNATIEHVGSFENQKKMIQNIMLLSRKYFVITTPNRYHPIDFHTKLPILHWFPKNIHRTILKIFKLEFFSKEENLNLLNKNELQVLLKICGISNYKIFDISLLGFKSNFIVIGKINLAS